jgi:signal recognition particle GTPase
MKGKLNKKVLLAACDIYRPAAIDQLEQIAGESVSTSFLNTAYESRSNR